MCGFDSCYPCILAFNKSLLKKPIKPKYKSTFNNNVKNKKNLILKKQRNFLRLQNKMYLVNTYSDKFNNLLTNGNKFFTNLNNIENFKTKNNYKKILKLRKRVFINNTLNKYTSLPLKYNYNFFTKLNLFNTNTNNKINSMKLQNTKKYLFNKKKTIINLKIKSLFKNKKKTALTKYKIPTLNKKTFASNFSLSNNFTNVNYNYSYTDMKNFSYNNLALFDKYIVNKNFYGVNIWDNMFTQHSLIFNLLKFYKKYNFNFLNLFDFINNKSIIFKNYINSNFIKNFQHLELNPKKTVTVFITFNRSKLFKKASKKMNVSKRKKKIKTKKVLKNKYYHTSYNYLKYLISNNLEINTPFKKSYTKHYHKFYKAQSTKSKDLDNFFSYFRKNSNLNRLLNNITVTNKLKKVPAYYIKNSEIFSNQLIKITDNTIFLKQQAFKKKFYKSDFLEFKNNPLKQILMLNKNDNIFESNIDLYKVINPNVKFCEDKNHLVNFFQSSDFRNNIYGIAKTSLFLNNSYLDPIKKNSYKPHLGLNRKKYPVLAKFKKYLSLTWVNTLINLYRHINILLNFSKKSNFRNFNKYNLIKTKHFSRRFLKILNKINLIKPIIKKTLKTKNKKVKKFNKTLISFYKRLVKIKSFKKRTISINFLRNFYLQFKKIILQTQHILNKKYNFDQQIFNRKSVYNVNLFNKYVLCRTYDKRKKRKILYLKQLGILYYTLSYTTLKYKNINNTLVRQLKNQIKLYTKNNKNTIKNYYRYFEKQSLNYDFSTNREEKYILKKKKLKKRNNKILKKRSAILNKIDLFLITPNIKKLAINKYLNSFKFNFFNTKQDINILNYKNNLFGNKNFVKRNYFPILLKNIFFLPIILKSSIFTKWLILNLQLGKHKIFSHNTLNQSLLNLTKYYFNSRVSILKLSNLWPTTSFNFTIKKRLLKIIKFEKFSSNVILWYYNTLVRFIENCTGKKVFLKFNPFIENSLPFVDIARSVLWESRVILFKQILGPKIFLNESLRIFHMALRYKDPTFLLNWIKGMLLRMNFWKYRLLIRYIKYIMRYLFWNVFEDLNFKGMKLKLKGKISVAGNARTRTILFRIGSTSHSKFNNKILTSFDTINTFTGVLGFQIWFFF